MPGPRDPIPALPAAGDVALAYFVRRDLLGEPVGPASVLWELPEPQRLLRKQQADGSWRYPAGNPASTPGSNYAVLETFRSLGILVEKFGFDRSHLAVRVPRSISSPARPPKATCAAFSATNTCPTITPRSSSC